MEPVPKPPMPCIAYPNPTSMTSTPFTYERRHFTQKTLPDDFPYEVIRDNGLQVHYFEFRGQGPPPDDLGHPGDVWLNLKPGEYALSARMLTEWVLWPGPRKAKKQMFAHPLVEGRYLWCTRKHVLWYTCDGIRKSASLQMRGEEEDFGRHRYRTVGPMERGGARSADDGVPRMPLRTAAEAIAKILEMEGEERRNGREPPEPKRRRIRDLNSPSASSSGREGKRSSVPPNSARQDSVVSVSTTSVEPSSSALLQQPQPQSDPHTLQSYGTHPFPVQSTSSSLSQALEPPISISAQPLVSRSAVVPAPSAQMRTVYSQPIMTPIVPAQAQAQISPGQPTAPLPSGALRMLEAEIIRMRDETRRLSEESRRLNEENARLTEENRRLRAQPPGSCPPDLINAVKDSMATALGSRITSLLADAQEQRAARVEAERKLGEFQEQLRKITQAFQLPGMASSSEGAALSTPGPSPRLSSSET
ncbi:hypothetical protein EW146_g3261 [Bondarzewia mesenterica]|uniref:Uncharacterized protein n=1 Tax=Bondarzewia mesenterica TaxID=1095465 RepID=A0A4S4LY97_9AGAM|nr:hypothetical protein EW146_g3261 [Bondarzewia mesenterica]